MARKIRRKNPEIVRVDMDDMSYGYRKIMAPKRQQLLRSSPDFFESIGGFLQAIQDPKRSTFALSMEPASLEHLITFLIAHTTGVYGLVDEDDVSLAWDRLSDVERRGIYADELPVTLVQLYLRLLAADLKTRVPRGQGESALEVTS